MQPQMPESGQNAETQQKRSVSVLGVLIANFLLALGIAAIGVQAGNKKELYGGLAFFVMYLTLFYFSYVPKIAVATTLLGLFSLLSWAYILIRLFLLRNEVRLKII